MLRIDNQLKFSEYQKLYDVVVPKDNLLRKISETIDFSFVNEMLKKSYCETFGRPAKEPEMMFKIMFLKRMYDLSDEVLVDNLGYNMAFKYFIGLAPEDETIDPSLLTKFRKTRITKDILEEMLTETMRQAIEKGLVKSRAIIVDSTHTFSKGNPETPTQILRRMTKTLRKEIYKTQIELAEYFPEKPSETATIEEEIEYTKTLVTALEERLSYKATQKLLSRVKELLDGDKIRSVQSASDEEASVGHKSIDCSFFGYKSHLAMTDERLISAIEVTTGRNSDSKEMPSLVEQSERNGVVVEEVIGDMAFSSKDNIDYCDGKNIKLVSRLNTVVSNGNSRDDEFVYNKDASTMQCPEGHLAIRSEVRQGKYDNKYYNYFFSIKKCRKCSRYGTCCKEGAKSKSHNVTIIGGTRQKQYDFEQTDYFRQRIKDRYKIEAKNAELKQSHGLAKCKYVGLSGMKMQIYFSAFVVNIKRIVKLNEMRTA
ncbi:MAG: IS1182 family transposase [Tissierellales bacterium]|nr:IS1182 family transposase [Tissierellales bacterium]